MKRLVIAVLLLMLCALCGMAQSRNKRTTATPRTQPIVDIRQIDFRNFTYTLDGRAYNLRDGFYAGNVAPDTQWSLGMADGPYYGDLTGDKKDEVAFILRHGPTETPNAAEARVYTLQNGQPILLATFIVADSINCELDHYLKIEDGTITIERIYGKDSQCDHNEVTQYRWNGDHFAPVGTIKRMPCRCM
ncbi:MAG: hypothetical protein WBP93_10190 [Pyrinomonadaceae bacterium]